MEDRAVHITININIIAGDVTGSAVIQGGNENTVDVSSMGIPRDVLELLRLFPWNG